MGDEALSTLLNMGFGFEESTAALSKCKKDVSEAVAFLTDPSRSVVPFGPDNNKATQVMEVETFVGCPEKQEAQQEQGFSENALKDIKGRIFSENWSLTFNDTENVLECLRSAQWCLNNDSPDSCKVFIDEVLPTALTKLLTNMPGHDSNQQDAIFTIINTYIGLGVNILKKGLDVATLKNFIKIMDPRTEFNFRNRSKRPKQPDENDPCTVNYAHCPSRTSFRDPHGWLVTLINKFGNRGGFDILLEHVCTEDPALTPDVITLSYVLKPWGICMEYLVTDTVCPIFRKLMERSIKAINNMTPEQYKSKDIGLVCDLLLSMKYICSAAGSIFTSQDVKGMDQMRLIEIQKMLKTSHFNAKMNALNETLKLVEETRDLNQKNPIDSNDVLKWISEQHILIRALENNLHQAQYTAKLSRIAEFIGDNITQEDLTKFWELQDGRQAVVAENAHTILAAAAVQFNEQQSSLLFSLITNSWINENSKGRQRLLNLFKKLGKLPNAPDHVWALIHLKGVGVPEIECGLNLHLELIDSAYNPDELKKKYVMRCVSDIESNEWVIPAMKYFVRIVQSCVKSSSKLGKNILKELQNSVSAVKLITQSLVRTYDKAISQYNDKLHDAVKCIDTEYTLIECVRTHFMILKLILEHCSDYLQWCFVTNIWDCLTSDKAAPTHYDECCNWFASAMSELDSSTQTKFFEQRLLALKTASMRMPAFKCFKVYFESVNIKENKIKKTFLLNNGFSVESLKLTGLNFVWSIFLDAVDEDVSADAMNYLLNISLKFLSAKLKKDCFTLHANFTKHCQALLQETRDATENGGDLSAMGRKRIVRILNITTDYILVAESYNRGVRMLEPHGATYLGHIIPFNLEIDKENHEVFFHANEKVAVVRIHAAKILKTSPECIELRLAETHLQANTYDRRMLSSIPIKDGSVVRVKLLQTINSPVKSWNEEINTPVKFEKQLPGVLLTMNPQVHDTLHSISAVGGDVTVAVQKLLNCLPTDPRLIEVLESLSAGKVQNPLGILKKLLTGPVKKVVYNLEALSAKIMPVEKDSSDKQSLNNIFVNLTTELDGIAGAHTVTGLDLFYEIFNTPPVINMKEERRMDKMNMSDLFLEVDDDGDNEYIEAIQLVISVLRGLFFEISSPLFRHDISVNPTYLKKLNHSQVFTFMKFFTHMALNAAFSSPLQSWGQPLPNYSNSGVVKITEEQANVGREAFELVMLAACHHEEGLSVVFEIMELPGYKRTLLDMLLYTPSPEIRSLVASELQNLCSMRTGNSDNEMEVDSLSSVHQKLLLLLLKTPLPIWSLNVRDSQQRLFCRCTQFFTLCSFLVKGLDLNSMTLQQLNIKTLIDSEVKLLKAIGIEHQNRHHSFISGHIQLLCSLTAINGVDKRQIGKKLIGTLLDTFLFPAANMMFKGSRTRSQGLLEKLPMLTNEDIQTAAYAFLLTLVTNSPENSRDVTLELVRLHHQPGHDLATEWNYHPIVQSRSECGFVGLKNGGATCYMNAILQQLNAVPGLSESILSLQVAPSSPSRANQPNHQEDMFLQYQHLLGNLSESQLKYYTPEGFWKMFRLWGMPINLHEQQDAFEFFNNLTDQIDDVLKEKGEPRLYEKQFGGQFVDQKICHECPHRSELVEPFMSLSVSIRAGNLEESLEQFINGELLEGDNAYLCEECNEKRTTRKRTCIKTLPKTLVIHLKRFDYDFDRNKAFKSDEYFSFPNQLDMLPYTLVGLEGTPKQRRELSSLYSLSGVVVHSGQASAGHYYSFIRNKNTWYKFNDDDVSKVELNDQTMAEECFGGEFKSKGSTRNRYWSAYILLYDQQCDMALQSQWKKPISPTKRLKPSRLSLTKLSDIPDSPNPHQDRVNELEELIKTGEKSGLFHEKLPPLVRNGIVEANTKLHKERAVFNKGYFSFVRKLVITNITNDNIKDYTHWSVTLFCNFYLHTFLHISEPFQFQEAAWMDTFKVLMERDVSSPIVFLEFISSTRHHDYLTRHLLLCPKSLIRSKFAQLIKIALDCLQSFMSLLEDNGIVFISRYLFLISRELSENHKFSDHYFSILYHYVRISGEAAQHLRTRNYVSLFVNFLLGNCVNGDSQLKWTAGQLNNFSAGYQTLQGILQYTSLAHFHTVEATSTNPYLKTDVRCDSNPEVVSEGIHQIMTDGNLGNNLVAHLLFVAHSLPSCSATISNIVCMLCWCNQSITNITMSCVITKLTTVQAHELKPIFTLLLQLLALNDPYRILRVEHVIDGSNGLLGLVKSCSTDDPKRAYQCVKFLTQLLRSNPVAKEHILRHVTDWEWSVNWLKSAYETEAQVSTLSNDLASCKGFQRTTSAQETLSNATALLNEFESSQ